ncbi:MAG TPA: hypothetical protein VHT24_06705, partial [Pseudacidobacterium sp.]|nr:hypothetical protein [Pseudacidobacterium sp.]
MESPVWGRQFAIYLAGVASLCVCSLVQPNSAAQEASSLQSNEAITASSSDGVVIPGPLRSFLRMAGISQKIPPGDVLPLLARNVYLRGYENGAETEFLLLLDRYVRQARELQGLAGANGTIHVVNCNDATSLLQVLGYQLRPGCGQKNAYLTTASPERAFLTIDSGFPLTGLEEALQKGTSFSYAYPSTRVPVLFRESDWISASLWKKKSGNLVDVLIHDPSLARLYSAMAKNDAETGDVLARSPGLKKLLSYSAVFDFYGSQMSIRSGHVIVPGGAAAEPGWKDLVGASPNSPGDFVTHLLAKDNGWMAVYFDALSRVSESQQARLTQPSRLKHLYEAFRSSGTEPGATKGVFPKGSNLLILFTRLDWGPNGEPYVPGNLEVWQEILNQKTDFKVAHD